MSGARPATRGWRNGRKVRAQACRALVPLDTDAVRAAYVAACEAEIAALEEAEREVREYADDEHAYKRWLCLALGPLQADLRAAREACVAAYQAFRRAQADTWLVTSVIDPWDNAQGGTGWWGEHTTASERAAAHDAGDKLGGPRCSAARREARMEEDALLAGVEYEAVVERVKELYRNLCRKLHPDAGGRIPEGLEWLWEEAQAAYRDGDVRALFHLETRVLIAQGAYRRFGCVSDILAFCERVRVVTEALEERLATLRTSVAWGFRRWSAAQRERVLRQVQEAMEAEIASLEELAKFYAQGVERLQAQAHATGTRVQCVPGHAMAEMAQGGRASVGNRPST